MVRRESVRPRGSRFVSESGFLPVQLPRLIGQAGAGEGCAAAHERDQHHPDEEAEIPAADEKIAAALPAGLHDAQQDRVRGDESPGVVCDSKHRKES